MSLRHLLFVLLPACATPPPDAPAAPTDPQHAFDFHLGTWTTTIRRLDAPLTGSTTWLDYRGTTVVRPIWGGKANLVELTADGDAGHLELLSLRLFDPATEQWSLHVASSRGGGISPPSIGGFVDGRGEFYSDETMDGRAVRVRFVISDITATSCHFEQAFSVDGGDSWEVNWIAVDTR